MSDRRKHVGSFLRAVLDEAIPGGASLAYVFGSGLLYLFLSQVITGMFLVLYYVPSADHAHTTVAYITKEVTSGSFIRSIHAYGSSAIEKSFRSGRAGRADDPHQQPAVQS